MIGKRERKVTEEFNAGQYFADHLKKKKKKKKYSFNINAVNFHSTARSLTIGIGYRKEILDHCFGQNVTR